MIDGRFDQHFLEIFAAAQQEAAKGDPVPWLSMVSALLASVILGVGAILVT